MSSGPLHIGIFDGKFSHKSQILYQMWISLLRLIQTCDWSQDFSKSLLIELSCNVINCNQTSRQFNVISRGEYFAQNWKSFRNRKKYSKIFHCSEPNVLLNLSNENYWTLRMEVLLNRRVQIQKEYRVEFISLSISKFAIALFDESLYWQPFWFCSSFLLLS